MKLIDNVSLSISQRCRIAGIIPDRLPAAVIESAPLGVVLIRVNPAILVGLHHIGWKCEDVIAFVAQAPPLQLHRLVLLILDLHIFIRLNCAGSIVKDVRDLHVSAGKCTSWDRRRGRFQVKN